MTEDKIVLHLKEVVTHANGEPVKQPEKVKQLTKTDVTGKLVPKSAQEVMEEAPPLTQGELLSGILMNGVVPKDASEAAKLNRLAKAVNNVMVKVKGEWERTEEQVDELISLIGKVQLSQGIQLTIGACMDMLELAKQELLLKKMKKDSS